MPSRPAARSRPGLTGGATGGGCRSAGGSAYSSTAGMATRCSPAPSAASPPAPSSDRLAGIRAFEAELPPPGVVLVKLWMDIGRHAQRERLQALQADPALAWQVGPTEWQRHVQHAAIQALGRRLRDATEAALRQLAAARLARPGRTAATGGRGAAGCPRGAGRIAADRWRLASPGEPAPSPPRCATPDPEVAQRLDKSRYPESALPPLRRAWRSTRGRPPGAACRWSSSSRGRMRRARAAAFTA